MRMDAPSFIRNIFSGTKFIQDNHSTSVAQMHEKFEETFKILCKQQEKNGDERYFYYFWTEKTAPQGSAERLS
jgi:hypothetical protein